MQRSRPPARRTSAATGHGQGYLDRGARRAQGACTQQPPPVAAQGGISVERLISEAEGARDGVNGGQSAQHACFRADRSQRAHWREHLEPSPVGVVRRRGAGAASTRSRGHADASPSLRCAPAAAGVWGSRPARLALWHAPEGGCASLLREGRTPREAAVRAGCGGRAAARRATQPEDGVGASPAPSQPAVGGRGAEPARADSLGR